MCRSLVAQGWVIEAALMGLCAGCLAPVTDRLDAIHAELQIANQKMAETNDRLTETNRRLENIESLLKRFPLLKPLGELPIDESSESPPALVTAELTP